ncbi:hypothetical protein [Hydrogenophaga sp. H7]|uniref:hypothetical protein n=1 Tax=Hydrogenophaga sp. H7 TaxID=1882399 RepID=UPI00117AE113|nr:hypothetical protein [Hydrogenophaga sp. H7]
MDLLKFILVGFGLFFGVAIVGAIFYSIIDGKRLASLSPEQRAEEMAKRLKAKEAMDLEVADWRFKETYGVMVPAVICPHCAVQGHVSKKETTKITKNRVNSIPGRMVGLGTNSETQVTKMHCMNCTMDWEV